MKSIKKLLTGTILVLVLCLVVASTAACVPPGTSNPASTPTPTPTSVSTPVSGVQPPPIDRNWISPATVQISNFYPGATAEWSIQVHNGYTFATDKYLVTTEVGEYSAWIHLKKELKDSSATNVLGIYSTGDKTGTIPTNEVLVAIAYNSATNEIKIEGFVPDFARYLTIEYDHQSPTTYSVYYRNPDTLKTGYAAPPAGAQSWVLIADPSPVLAPYESREILVTLAMPTKAVAPDAKWEFWVGVKEKSSAEAGVSFSVELASTWLIEMRGVN